MLKENIYKEALQDISKASDQANPIQLRTVAQIALDSEPTTADEFNKEAEIAEYDRKLSEAAESTWRDTVLHPDYKSPFDEEE